MVFLLPLHASVLKPDLDLSFAEVENVCDLNATTTRQVSVEVKFFLQLERLMSRVRCSCAFAVRAVSLRYTPTQLLYLNYTEDTEHLTAYRFIPAISLFSISLCAKFDILLYCVRGLPKSSSVAYNADW